MINPQDDAYQPSPRVPLSLAADPRTSLLAAAAQRFLVVFPRQHLQQMFAINIHPRFSISNISNQTWHFFFLICSYFQLLPSSISPHPSIHLNPKLHRRSLLSSPAPQEWPASLDPSWLVQLPMISKEFSYLFMLGITWQKNMGAGCLLAV